MAAELPLNRKDKRKLEFQNRIKDAALALFRVHGITNTTVASIIKEADIAHKTFFNHFPSKDHFLEFLVRETMKTAFAGFDPVGEKALSPQQRIEKSFIAIAGSMELLDEGVKEVISYYFIGIEGPRHIRLEHTGKFRSYVHNILQEAKKNNQLRADFSVDVLTDMVVGIYSSTVMNWVSQENYPLLKKIKTAIKFTNSTIFVN